MKTIQKTGCLVGLVVLVMASVLISSNVQAGSGKPIELTAITEAGASGPPAKLTLDIANEQFKGEIFTNTVSIPFTVMFEKIMAEFVGRSTAYDIIPIQTWWVGATAKYMEDLNPYVRKYGVNLNVFPEGVLKFSSWDGKLIGLPFRTGINATLFYRQDLYAKYNLKVPKSMEEYYQNAKTITQREKGVYGVGLMSGTAGQVYEDFIVWFFSQGGRLLNDKQNGVVPFESKHGGLAVDVLKMWKRMHDEELLPPAHTTWTQFDVLRALQQGLVAQSNVYSARVTALEDPKESKTVGKWGYAPFLGESKTGVEPVFAGVSWTFGINPLISSERKEAAFKVLQVMVAEEPQKKAALEKANGPTLTSIYRDPEYQKANSASMTIAEGLKKFYAMVVPENAEIVNIIGEEAAAAIIGKKTPEAAARSIWQRTEAVFKK